MNLLQIFEGFVYQGLTIKSKGLWLSDVGCTR